MVRNNRRIHVSLRLWQVSATRSLHELKLREAARLLEEADEITLAVLVLEAIDHLPPNAEEIYHNSRPTLRKLSVIEIERIEW